MYNGVGLLSVRGSGTSGYVQTNRFRIRNTQTRTTIKHSTEESLCHTQDKHSSNHIVKRRIFAVAVKFQNDLHLQIKNMNLKSRLIYEKMSRKLIEIKRRSKILSMTSIKTNESTEKRKTPKEIKIHKIEKLAEALGITPSGHA